MMSVPSQKTNGRPSEIVAKMKNIAAFRKHLQEHLHIYDSENVVLNAEKYFNLDRNTALQIFKQASSN